MPSPNYSYFQNKYLHTIDGVIVPIVSKLKLNNFISPTKGKYKDIIVYMETSGTSDSIFVYLLEILLYK